MGMEWKEDKLGNLIQVKYGKDHKKLEDGKYPCYGSGGLMRFVESQIYDGPSILIPRKGTLNNIMYSESPFWTVDTMFWSIIDQDKIDPKYLFYHICKKDFAGMNVGSAVPSMTVPILNDIDILYPAKIEDQKHIADILSSLDAKIENNNKINAKLEEMAQALFKSWFIDFEPFKVGRDGSRPAFGSGNFVESELGMIPEGWKVGKLGDCTKLITKGTTPTSLKKEFKESGIVFVKAESIKEDHSLDFQKVSFIDEETNILLKRSIICPNDILFTIAGTLGRFCLVEREFSVANTNQAVAIIRLNEDYLPAKVFFSYLLGNWHKDYCIRNIQQAVQANLSLKTISCMPILVPDSDTLRKYTCVIEPIISKMKELEIENRTLAQTRDTLLPKLMSGEIEL